MKLIDILLTSISLAMDAFAVSICKGLSMNKYSLRKGIIVGTYFSIFQSIMPLIGYLIGLYFENTIKSIDHWISFILLLIIGINLIRESFINDNNINDDISIKEMIPLSIATSIDALAVGITFALLKINLLNILLIIGLITFIISIIGTRIGYLFGNKYENKSKIIGGFILIIIGIKILFEHLHIYL